MQAFLEIIRGPFFGQRVEVGIDEPLLVGRVAEAGISIPGDATISRRHCQINFVAPAWYLTNMSDNGTYLNGRNVLEDQLKSGDEIAIGNSTVLRFLVVVDEEANPTVMPHMVGAADQTAPVRRASATYSAVACPSGWVRYVPCSEQIPAAELARRLAVRRPQYLIIDYNRLELPPAQELGPQEALFDWLPPAAIHGGSPFVAPAQSLDVPALFAAGWGRDGIVCMHSRTAPDELLAHLRAATRFNLRGEEMPRSKGLLGYFWPSLLEQLLLNQPARFVSRLLTKIDAVLIESADNPAGWQLFAPAEFDRHLAQMGLEPATPDQPKP